MDLTEKTSCGNRHPWELSRTRRILDIVKNYAIRSIADVGAGDRFFLSKLPGGAALTKYAVDTGYTEKSEIIDGILCFNDISELPEPIDAVMLMDVIEHIQDDSAFLEKILTKLSAGALVIVTVPAFQMLFSNHDVFLKHYRRYGRKQLLTVLRSNNLCVERCHYFYASLFFVRFISLLLTNKKKGSPQSGIGSWRFGENHILTKTIRIILNVDFSICAFLAKFKIYPPGLSLLAVCRKQ
ncbi:hypothetical protein R80B4_01963 [Fibrobacteres bacterium R8-0-B4]